MKQVTITIKEGYEVDVMHALSRLKGVNTVNGRHPVVAFEIVNPLKRIEDAPDYIEQYLSNPKAHFAIKDKTPMPGQIIVYEGRRGLFVGEYGNDFCQEKLISEWMPVHL